MLEKRMSRSGLMRLGVTLLLILSLVGGSLAFFWSNKHSLAKTGEETPAGEDEPAAVEITVRTIHPLLDQKFTMTESRPADIRPYFQADLETKATGLVSMIRVDRGTPVHEGDVLVKVAVPDLDARVAQREADRDRAVAQVDQKKAAKKTIEAELKAFEAKVRATKAKLKKDQAYLDYRYKQLKRYEQLLELGSIKAQLVDEQNDQYAAAWETVNATTEAVAAAEAVVESTKSKIAQAAADIVEAERNVDVAEAQWKYEKAMLGYATIKAPFDGTIVRRSVDPGFFVQNAGNGRATPLLTIQRNDIVTVVMAVPDNFAPYVNTDTEAVIESPSLPGVKIHGKVTRFALSLDNPQSDRTMPVEVDLWNGPVNQYEAKMKDETFTKQLKTGMPGDPLGGKPILPEIKGKLTGGRKMRLMPGMYCRMTLVLRNFDNAYMLPNSAIITPGGSTYIYVARNGKAHLQPVKVQAEDGRLALVELLNAKGEILGGLTGKEEVIVSNQSELSEGQPVKTTLIEDWRSPGEEKKAR